MAGEGGQGPTEEAAAARPCGPRRLRATQRLWVTHRRPRHSRSLAVITVAERGEHGGPGGCASHVFVIFRHRGGSNARPRFFFVLRTAPNDRSSHRPTAFGCPPTAVGYPPTAVAASGGRARATENKTAGVRHTRRWEGDRRRLVGDRRQPEGNRPRLKRKRRRRRVQEGVKGKREGSSMVTREALGAP